MDQGTPSASSAPKDTPLPLVVGVGLKRTGSDGSMEAKQRQQQQQQRAQAQVADPHWVLEKQHVDTNNHTWDICNIH